MHTHATISTRLGDTFYIAHIHPSSVADGPESWELVVKVNAVSSHDFIEFGTLWPAVPGDPAGAVPLYPSVSAAVAKVERALEQLACGTRWELLPGWTWQPTEAAERAVA